MAACSSAPNNPTTTVGPPTPPSRAARPAASPTPSPTSLPTPTREPRIEMDGVELPPGFSIIKFTDVKNPTALTFDANGNLFTVGTDFKILAWIDEDKDGRADSSREFATAEELPLGLAVHPDNGNIYLSSTHDITIFKDQNGDLAADDSILLVGGLPTGLHQNDNLKFGPDGLLYMGLGSTCDACIELDSRSGTILRFNPISGTGEIFARGLRNPYDLAFHPDTGELFATDNGRDDLGMDAPNEEINHIIQGGDYGWPGCWNAGEGYNCAGKTHAIGFFEPHSSANSIDIYPGGPFPEEFSGNAFVTIFGSWLKPGVQTGIQRVKLIPDGGSYRTEIEWFVKFPQGVMPLGLVAGPDGALYVGDYISGAIWRISYGGE